MPEPTSVELEFREVATGLQFPEGPVAMPDGSVILTEIARGTVTRIDPASGSVEVLSDCGGGPNGLAVGPDGMLYLCNNGGFFTWTDLDGLTVPGPTPEAHENGAIQRIDPATGAVETLYEACDGTRLTAPNDLVLDAHGGLWFTDHGVHGGDAPGLLYATVDGSEIRGVAFGTVATNGVGLSPDGSRVYVAETHAGQLWEWAVGDEPGTLGAPLDPDSPKSGGRLLFDAPENWLFDSLAVDGDGWVCVATIGLTGGGGITAVAPDGSAAENISTGDFLTTNICFGGAAHGSTDEHMGTAYVTCSSSGRLLVAEWPRPGLRLQG